MLEAQKIALYIHFRMYTIAISGMSSIRLLVCMSLNCLGRTTYEPHVQYVL